MMNILLFHLYFHRCKHKLNSAFIDYIAYMFCCRKSRRAATMMKEKRKKRKMKRRWMWRRALMTPTRIQMKKVSGKALSHTQMCS